MDVLSLGRPLDVRVQLSSQRLNDECGDRGEGQAGDAPGESAARGWHSELRPGCGLVTRQEPHLGVSSPTTAGEGRCHHPHVYMRTWRHRQRRSGLSKVTQPVSGTAGHDPTLTREPPAQSMLSPAALGHLPLLGASLGVPTSSPTAPRGQEPRPPLRMPWTRPRDACGLSSRGGPVGWGSK